MAPQPWPSPSLWRPRPRALSGTWWPPVGCLGWEGSVRECCLQLCPRPTPVHPARHSPARGSCRCRFEKSVARLCPACCKNVQCHPRAAGTLGELAQQAPHPRGARHWCLSPAHNPACAGSPQLTSLRCLSLPSSTCPSCAAWERYLHSLSARSWVSTFFRSFCSVSEKGEVTAKAGMDLWEPAELLG